MLIVERSTVTPWEAPPVMGGGGRGSRRCRWASSRPRRARVSATMLLLCLPGALGWGRDGHRIVAEIASRHLTAKAREELNNLLKDERLPDVSTWADDVRNEAAYRWSAPLHYVNIPKDAEGYDATRDCPKGECVVEAVRKYRDVLADGKAAAADRVEALKFLVHFVGDLHQPLHAGYAADRGGNDITVEFLGESMNLHALWDTGLLGRTGKMWTHYAEELHQRITDENRKAWSSTDPGVWATESFRLAVSHAYALPEDRRIGEAYYVRNRPVIEDRLSAAGVRLALMINAALDPPPGDGAPGAKTPSDAGGRRAEPATPR